MIPQAFITLGENTLRVPWIFAHLASRCTDELCTGVSFQGYLYSKQPGDIEKCLITEQKVVLFTVQYNKDNASHWDKI